MIRPTLLALILSLSACTSPSVGECPVDLDIIVPLMTELHLAESLAYQAPNQVKDSMQKVYFNKVLQDHQLNRESFDSLMWIVRQEPVWVDSLYTRIGVELARMETAIK